MPTKKQKQKEFLGRAIFKQRFGGNIKDDPKTSGLHTSDIDQNAEKAKKMQSVTQFTDFQELFDYANLAEKDFSAEKQNAIVITADQQKQQRVMLTKEYPIEIMMKHWNDVTIPRRPPWDENTTAEELQETEKQSFLEWRRRLAKMEEEKGLLLSPFEKNIEVWRQLWRVVERSEIIVQIVDARNPLLFRNPDLEKYVKEVDEDKINILLINKADLLSKQQRLEWAKYFTANNVEFLFFSANYEKLKMEQKTLEKQKLLKQHVEEEMDLEEQEALLSESEDSGKEDEEEGEQDEAAEYAKVLNREDLLDYLMQFYDEELHTDEEGNRTRMTIGMVGFPNVGKSSTINVLVGEKKVSVSSTPGKTKHFQTINIDEHIQLCDCPGLVFPTFMSTKAEMICNGLLSIDHMREHNAPVTLLARRIPREILEKSYGIVLPKPKPHEDPNREPTAEEVLQAHATVRGYMTARGTPNESVSAREILKDYVTGLLVYAHSPPGINPKEFNKTTKILNKKLSTKKTMQHEILEEKEEKVQVPVGKQEEEEEEEEPKENKMETLTIGKKSKKKKKANRKHLEPTVKTYDPLEDPDFKKQEKVVAVTTGKHAKVNFVRPKVYHTVVPVAQLRAAKKQLEKTQALPRTVSKESNDNK